MPKENRPLSAPRQLGIGGGEDAASLTLSPTHVALHGLSSAQTPIQSSLVLDEEGIAVVARTTTPPPGARSGPVYTTDGAAFAVPTGRVFLRMQEGQDPETVRAAIERTGFTLEEIPVYAPHAVWLAPRGEIAEALALLPELERVPGVVKVEPEILRERGKR